jgi:hypothetical protein
MGLPWCASCLWWFKPLSLPVECADIPDIQDQIAQCQEAVDMALRIQQDFMDQLNRKAGEF